VTKPPADHAAFVLQGNGFDTLHLQRRATPAPIGTQVLVRMRAASLNYRDLKIIEGRYAMSTIRPLVPLSDGAGEVVAVGDAVAAWKAGDRVLPIYMQGWYDGPFGRQPHWRGLGGDVDGTAREYALFDQQDLLPIPDAWSFVEAATLPCAAVTAWHALVSIGGVKPGDTVLTQGSGGVSVFALQIAMLRGASVIATSSDDAKLARLKALGAAEGVNYRASPDWDQAVRHLTGGRGVDIVVEVGGGDTFDRSICATRDGGQVLRVGDLSGGVDPARITVERGVAVTPIVVGSRQMTAEAMLALAASTHRPVIDRVQPFRALPDALKDLAAGRHFGKIVLEF
jgi:NADPH:quinone reductase-like Zn-dependent oxidoreductase